MFFLTMFYVFSLIVVVCKLIELITTYITFKDEFEIDAPIYWVGWASNRISFYGSLFLGIFMLGAMYELTLKL